jgi:D-sedoheptulose 7-phosphate isomerase
MEVVVFTNGCFDLLHAGHVELLTEARSLGTKLVVGINSDASVKKIKGAERPFVNENDRAAVLLALEAVDEVRVFDEPTPARLIEEIKPDVLVKGGDWQISEIVGADFVLKRGGKVFSFPLKNGYSTTALAEKIKADASTNDRTETNTEANDELNFLEKSLSAHLEVFQTLLRNHLGEIETAADLIWQALQRGNKILLCGNGGSAADAQHIAAEFVGRFERERRSFPSIALTTDTSALTAIGNDYGFERIFARQVEALANEGDVLIGISTSGNSPNVIAAIMTARKMNCATVGLTGAAGKKLAALCDAAVLVPATRTSRIQEAHNAIGHLWCEFVDEKLATNSR